MDFSCTLFRVWQDVYHAPCTNGKMAYIKVTIQLGLRQVEAGHLFGGGSSAFSEYERGKTQPHKSTVLLFKLLDRHPELLDELRAA